MVFKNGVKHIQAAAYNDERTVFKRPGGTFFVILRRAIIEAGLVCSPDKDGDRGDVKVFSLLPSFFSLGVDDTLDSLGLLTVIQNQ